jgi:membrane associated rhomboid family serine protease
MNEPATVALQLDPEKVALRKYLPVMTLVICGLCLILFIGINFEQAPLTWNSYRKWGICSPDDIWSGKLWGLLTSNFVHVQYWHILFNVWWFWKFGKKIEYVSSKSIYLFLIISSGIICSIYQLLFSVETGFGLSGIVYAMFGYIWVRSGFENAYKQYLTKGEIRLFIIWLFLCIVLSKTNIMPVANGAHFSGLAWGALLAYLLYGERRKWGIPVLGSLFLISCSPFVFGAPWNTSWQYHKAWELTKESKYDEALAIYEQILQKNPNDGFAEGRRKTIHVDILSKKAYDAQVKEDFPLALRLYDEILSIDPENQWAKDNRGRIPEGIIR